MKYVMQELIDFDKPGEKVRMQNGRRCGERHDTSSRLRPSPSRCNALPLA